jgi:hypothetical protein
MAEGARDSEDLDMRFFHPLLVPDETERAFQTQRILEEILLAAQCAMSGPPEKKESCQRFVACHVQTLARLARECPFQDMRVSFGKVVSDLEQVGELSCPLLKLIR